MNRTMGWAALLGIYAALIFDIFSTTNSSPQTTQLFARERAGTLWKWVKIGALISVIFIALAVVTELKTGDGDAKKNAGAIITGGFVSLAIMWWMYSHALKEGGGSKPGKQAYAADW